MSFVRTHLLNLAIFAPLVFAAVVVALPQQEKQQIRVVTLLGMVATLLLTLALYLGFEPAGPEFQF